MPYVHHTRKKMDIFTSCVTENLHFSYSDNTTLFILKNINIILVINKINEKIFANLNFEEKFNLFSIIFLFPCF